MISKQTYIAGLGKVYVKNHLLMSSQGFISSEHKNNDKMIIVTEISIHVESFSILKAQL